MHDALHLSSVFRAHRQHITAVAFCHNRILQVLLHGRGVNHCGEPLLDLSVSAPDPASDLRKFSGRRIAHLLRTDDTAFDLLLQSAVRIDPGRHRGQKRRDLRSRRERPADLFRAAQRLPDIQKLVHGQYAARIDARQMRSHILKRLDRRVAPVIKKRFRLRRLLQQILYLFRIVRRPPVSEDLASENRSSFFRQHAAYSLPVKILSFIQQFHSVSPVKKTGAAHSAAPVCVQFICPVPVLILSEECFPSAVCSFPSRSVPAVSSAPRPACGNSPAVRAAPRFPRGASAARP